MTAAGSAAQVAIRPGSVGARLDSPALRALRRRRTQVAIVLAITALPLLRPAGPGNTGLVDLALLAALLVTAVWASARSLRIRLPYALPVGLSVLAGAMAATIAATVGNVSSASILALAQDVFVFGWAVAVVTVGQDAKLLDTLTRAWAYSVTAWAAALIVGEFAGIGWLSGINASDGVRAALTLGDPNLAANYFLVGLFVMRAARRPRHTLARWLACAVVVTAIGLTLSNGGMLALLVATILGALFRMARRRGLAAAVAAGAALCLAAGALVAAVDVKAIVTKVELASPWLRDSVGREGESSGSRSTLATEGVRLWLTGDALLGLGPANTGRTLAARQAPYSKEAHDDYLAALLERGVLGGIALVLLIGAVAVRARRISRPGGVGPEHLAVVQRPELLAAAAVAIGLSAMVYEVLHFRHVWALLGLIAVLDLSSRAIPVRRQ